MPSDVAHPRYSLKDSRCLVQGNQKWSRVPGLSTGPEPETISHAGAVVSGSAGTAQAKKEALEAAGVKVGKTPSETATLLREIYAAL
ncbi:hypothetical protein GCM10025778_00740 [Paeniglutamicibacter antarcticus]|uniref:Uncharacterized protein n=1 Tax=Paeniglutamicibacter antarcticus TaxID=494023 RepID=A0ABP9TFM2_9MICC